MEIGARIVELRNQKKISQAELAKRSGVSQAGISYIEKGQRSPSAATIELLANALGCSSAYLMGESVKPLKNVSARGCRIPVVGDVAAGVPIEAIQDILDYEEIAEELAQTGEYFGLRLKGDSMAPRMQSGDVVIVRQQDDVENGEIAVVLVNGDSATVKQVKKLAEGIMLIPYNKDYETMFYTAQECAALPVRIIGKVIECRIKL